ncbi:MAG: hypothetical protein AB1500_11905 [Bacillota bacterium]
MGIHYNSSAGTDNRIPNLQKRLSFVGADVPAPKKQSPGLLTRVLDVLAAPGEAVAGTVKGIGPVQGVKQKTHFSSILRDIGWGGGPAATIGFTLDALLDPLNLVSFGIAGPAVKGAAKFGKLGVEAGEKARLVERAVQAGKSLGKQSKLSDVLRTISREGPVPIISEATHPVLKDLGLAEGTNIKQVSAKAMMNRARASREAARKPPDLGGLKIAGQTVIPGATLTAPFKALAGTGPAQALAKSAPGEAVAGLGEALGRLFSTKKAAEAATKKMAAAVTAHANELAALRKGAVESDLPEEVVSKIAADYAAMLGSGAVKSAEDLERVTRSMRQKLAAAQKKAKVGKVLVPETKAIDVNNPVRMAREILAEHARRRGIAQQETGRYLQGIETVVGGIGPEDRRKVLNILEDVEQFRHTTGLSPEGAQRLQGLTAQARQMEESLARDLARYQRDTLFATPNLVDNIRQRGGIRIQKGQAFATEFLESVPQNVRRLVSSKKGLPLDEMADELGMSANDLIQALAGGGSDVASKGARKALNVNEHIHEARRYLESNVPEYQVLQRQLEELNTRALEQYVKGDEHLLPVVETLRKLMRTIGTTERKLGLLPKTIEQYAPHIRNPEVRLTEEDLGKLAEYFGFSKQRIAGLASRDPQERLKATAVLFNPHANEREIKATVKEINDVLGKEFFTEDAALAVGVRGVRSIQARQAYLFAEGALSKWGVPVTPDMLGRVPVPEGFGAYRVAHDPATGKVILREINSNDILEVQNAQITREQLKAKLGQDAPMPEFDVPFMAVFPRDMASSLNRMSQTFFGDEDMRALLRAYDGALSVWRGLATVVRPGYHIRNATGNFWNNWLADIKDPRWYALAAQVQRDPNAIIDTKIGQLDRETLWRIMEERGVVGATFAGAELGHRGYAAIREAIGQGSVSLKPWKAEFAPARLGRAVGISIEDNAKIAHFLAKLNETGDPDAAAVSVKKFLFDYFDLTDFEKNVMKRIIPFYTWQRKNIPLQLEYLIKRPGKAAKAEDIQAAFAAATGEDQPTWEQQPPWFQEMLPLRIGKQGQAETYFNPSLPPQDINLLNLSQGSVRGNLSGTLQNVMSMMTPAAKIPVELATNRQLFAYPQQVFYDQVPADTRQDVGELGRYLAGQVPPLRGIINLLSPQGGRPREGRDWWRLAGLSPMAVDREKVAAQREREYYEQLQAIRRRLEAQGVEVPGIREIKKRGRLY